MRHAAPALGYQSVELFAVREQHGNDWSEEICRAEGLASVLRH